MGENFSPSTLRIIDANLNRLREGIRVVEDICRYYKNSKELSSKLKSLRHLARLNDYTKLLTCRDILNDPLKETTLSEKSRDDIEGIIISNFKRAQESSRVLEEFTKLISLENSENFKHIRYELYDIEKNIWIAKLAYQEKRKNQGKTILPAWFTLALKKIEAKIWKDLFKKFNLEYGELQWNDYDLAFPIYDLYKGTI